jgi:hypothetical protein
MLYWRLVIGSLLHGVQSLEGIVLRGRIMTLPVVNPAGQDYKKIAIQPINQPVLFIDAARPAPSQVFPQGLGFADASEGIAQASLD